MAGDPWTEVYTLDSLQRQCVGRKPRAWEVLAKGNWKREDLIPPARSTAWSLCVSKCVLFVFPYRKHLLAITWGQGYTTARAPESLPSTAFYSEGVVSQPPAPLSHSRVQHTQQTLRRHQSLLKMFEKGSPIMTWRQSQKNLSWQSCANGDDCLLPTGLQGIFQKDSASSFNLADRHFWPNTALFQLSYNPLAGCEITWIQPIFFNETE